MKKPKKPTITFHLFTDRKKEFRWRAIHRNGKIIAVSGEGYKRRSACLRSLERFVKSVFDVDIAYANPC